MDEIFLTFSIVLLVLVFLYVSKVETKDRQCRYQMRSHYDLNVRRNLQEADRGRSQRNIRCSPKRLTYDLPNDDVYYRKNVNNNHSQIRNLISPIPIEYEKCRRNNPYSLNTNSNYKHISDYEEKYSKSCERSEKLYDLNNLQIQNISDMKKVRNQIMSKSSCSYSEKENFQDLSNRKFKRINVNDYLNNQKDEDNFSFSNSDAKFSHLL